MKNILFILLLFPALCFSQIDGKIKGNITGNIQSSMTMAGGGPSTQEGEVYYGDYFVDIDNGNDENSGTEIDEAWQNISKVVTEFGNGTFGAGDTIVFKTGCTWAIDNVFEITGSSGESGNPIVIDGGSWGTGENAIILSNSDGGAIPKYYSLCHIAACDYITIQNLTFDGNDTERHGVTIGGSNTVYGPTAQNDERFITIQDCRIIDVGTSAPGSYQNGLIAQTWNNDIYNITFLRNYINSTSASGMLFYAGRPNLGATVATGHNLYFAYDTIINAKISTGVGSSISLDGGIDSALVEYCYTDESENGGAAGILISPDTSIVQSDVHVRYNTFLNHSNYPLDVQGRYTDSAGVLDTYIYYNIFFRDSAATGKGHCYIQDWDFEAGSKLRFYNNVFIGGYSGACLKSSSETVNLVTFKNNIFLNYGTNGLPCLLNFTYDNTIEAHSNNSYYCAHGSPPLYVFINSVAYHNDDMGEWEATATITDPLFIIEFTDLHLQNGSPCENTGVNIPTIPQFDFEGTAVADPPEIGAYEK